MRIRSQLGRGTIVLLRLPADGRTMEADADHTGDRITPLPNGNVLRGPEAVQELNAFLVSGLRAVG
jgi:hypothetical protein